MIQGRRVLVVVPARGGSQGVKLKNLRTVGGVSLVARVGQVVSSLEFVDRAVVSTDHPEIARAAVEAGLEAPFVRPESLSGPVISDWQVLSHALEEMERIDRVTYDVVVMLQPTSPSRTADHVRRTVTQLVDNNLDAVWTVSPTDLKSHPLKQLTVDDTGRLSFYDPKGSQIIARQQLQSVYHRNGVAYAFTRRCLMEEKAIMAARSGAVVLDGPLVNIDTEQDLQSANAQFATAGDRQKENGSPGRAEGDTHAAEGQTAACPICSSIGTDAVHVGPIRAGVFGTFVSARILRCRQCGTDRLQTTRKLSEGVYRTGEYRELVGESREAGDFLALHDPEQFEKLPFVAPVLRRGAVLADVGCGGGSFLDFVKGVSGKTIAVEPTESFHRSLRSRGHEVFSSTMDCRAAWQGRVDLAVSFSVVEHVPDPVAFLSEIRELLSADGRLLISTPNREDILLKQGSPDYKAFFYRQVHLFYFDSESLRRVCERAGLEVLDIRFHQRFGFTNFVNWLDKKRPTGRALDPLLSPGFDEIWKSQLERDGLADYLYLVARRR